MNHLTNCLWKKTCRGFVNEGVSSNQFSLKGEAPLDEVDVQIIHGIALFIFVY